MEPILSAAILALLALVTLGGSLIGARRLGLTDVQKTRRTEEAATLAALKDRLGIVERNAADLTAKVAQLEAARAIDAQRIASQQETIEAQASEIAELHELISDGALDMLRAVVAERKAQVEQQRRRRPTT